MNRIMIAGVVLSSNGRPARGAIVNLQSVTCALASGRSARGPASVPVSIIRSPRPNTDTNEQGGFVLYCGMESTESLMLIDHGQFDIWITECVGETRQTITYAGTGQAAQGPLVPVVSLRRIADGNIPDPRELSSFGSDVVRTYAQARQLCTRLPFMGLTIFPPSPESVEFFGAAVVRLLARRR